MPRMNLKKKDFWVLLPLFLQLSSCWHLNYTLYKGNPQQIMIPSYAFESEDPFTANLGMNPIFPTSISDQTNLSSLVYGPYMEPICTFNPFTIEIYPLIAFASNTSKNFDFVSVKNYIYFFDSTNDFSIFEISTTSDGVYSSVSKENQYQTEYGVDDNSFIRFFNDQNINLYLITDAKCIYYSIKDSFKYPAFMRSVPFNLRNESAIQTVDFYQGCFVFLMQNAYVDMHCFDSLQTGFNVTLGLGEQQTKDLLTKQQLGFSGWNYTDMLIDENGVLLISDFVYGIITLDISDPTHPNYLGLYSMAGVTKLKKIGQSVMVLRQFYNNISVENRFEEYYTRINYTSNDFWFDQNAVFYLSQNPIKEIHAARNYVILLQDNAMYLYRHSITKLLGPNLISLQGFVNSGMIGMHRMDNDEDKNLFIAIFPYKFAIYNIDIMNITLQCEANLEMAKGDYLLNFSIFSTSCSLLDNSVQNGSNFSACVYNIPSVVTIYESGTTAAQNDKTGLIAGLVVGLFFAFLIIVICGCYVIRLQKKYEKMEEHRGSNIQAGKGGIIGGYEDSEKQSNEPKEHFAPVGSGIGSGFDNKLELADNNNRN